MNDRQTELYNNLIALCEQSESFYFADHELDDVTYRIFNYRIASYTEFLLPDGLECRGHTFKINADGDALELVAWPFRKFFNYREVSSDINTLCKALILTGRLSREVYETAKREHTT